jgi:hypothetical protein
MSPVVLSRGGRARKLATSRFDEREVVVADPLASLSVDLTCKALDGALHYLEECGIYVPPFRRRVLKRWGGSYVNVKKDGSTYICLGCYPTRGFADWFAMHELAHVLVAAHEPGRRRKFRVEFGDPEPDDYDDQQWKGMLGPIGIRRPAGYASMYGRDGGGEEHFAELVALMYCGEDEFAGRPPRDLRHAWSVAWKDGLSLMTRPRLRG